MEMRVSGPTGVGLEAGNGVAMIMAYVDGWFEKKLTGVVDAGELKSWGKLQMRLYRAVDSLTKQSLGAN